MNKQIKYERIVLSLHLVCSKAIDDLKEVKSSGLKWYDAQMERIEGELKEVQ